MDTNYSDGSSSRTKLFEYLASSEGMLVPSSSLTEKLHSSRQAVYKIVCALKEEGIGIDSVPQKGYILNDINNIDAMSPTLIEFLMRGNAVFHKCIYFPQVSSTQQVIKKLAVQDAPEGIVAVSDEQTGGRGRRGRIWQAPAGKNLLFSMLLRPNLQPGYVQLLNLAAGLAVRNVLRSHYNIQADLKWPNDILVNGSKICGILSEAAGEPDRIYYAVTGIGINVNLSRGDFTEDIQNTATSLMIETATKISRPLLLARILNDFANFIKELGKGEGKASLLSAYRGGCATIGKDVRIIQDEDEYRGFAVGVTEQGALIVKIDGEDKIFAAADVHHLRIN